MPLTIIRDDITHVKADAIVNTANPNPIYGSGTDSAIYKAAGEKSLLAERQKIGVIAPGQCAHTPAFKLNARYIIHTVGPAWVDGKHDEECVLRLCYENSLQMAYDLECKSVAFPLIASGSYGYPKEKALQIATSSINGFLMEHNLKVLLVVFDNKAFELSNRLVERVAAYVDANYVEDVHAKEYCRYPSLREIALSTSVELFHGCTRRAINDGVRIETLVGTAGKSFRDKIFEYMDAKGLTAPQVYNAVEISRQLFAKMQKEKDYHPNKNIAVRYCLGLQLTIRETIDLLNRAGWSLSQSDKADLIIKGCIINGIYDIYHVDTILEKYGCATLLNYDK